MLKVINAKNYKCAFNLFLKDLKNISSTSFTTQQNFNIKLFTKSSNTCGFLSLKNYSTEKKSEFNYDTIPNLSKNDGEKIEIDYKNDEQKITEQSAINVDEEMLRYDYEEYEEISEIQDEHEIEDNQQHHLPDYMTKRGVQGVFDLPDLCALLEDEKAINVVCLTVPPEYKYCDHLVLLTGKSKRHLRAMAEKIKKTYKLKRNNSDPDSVIIEGLDATDWLAIDMGNIVVHLFMEDVRLKYNLEELWTVGPELDSHCIEGKKVIGLNTGNKDKSKEDMDDYDAVLSLDSFSFDKELERVKKLRLSEKLKENIT